ncbi:MAG: DUF434 domain-containing protein [Nitrososphaerota archaeon]|nr:DUF434 domain-containing protein [Aigarchaeota archaeon]MDW8076946.1 DUF434 domain-containing protein [Nitrososphaerota archaeon]
MEDIQWIKNVWDRLIRAVEDTRYLLDRDYKRESVVNFVASRYVLDKMGRSILYRCVYSSKDVKKVREKAVSPHDLKGSGVVVDGFNVLNTLQSFVNGKLLVLCDDGVVRDISEVHGEFRPTGITEDLIRLSVRTLKELKVADTSFYYEMQISMSGEISALTRRILQEEGVEGSVKTEKSVDSALLRDKRIVITSDSVVIHRADRFFDLAGYIILREKPPNLISLRSF